MVAVSEVNMAHDRTTENSINIQFIMGGKKMKQYTRLLLAVVMVFLLTAAGACTKKAVKKDAGLGEESAAQGSKLGEAGLEEAQSGGPQWNEPTAEMAVYFQDINFDYDKVTLGPEAKERLNKLGEWLLKNTSVQVLVEGHCDDRGTAEYNLALGERRAHAAKNYLVQLGINGDRISTISYGKERPLDPGHNEAAWAKNRRDHFLYR
jgi:peptidoglycan-associated lipoprotein